MEALFADLQPWHWFILGIGLIILETVAPGEIFLWVGVGAIATGLITFGLTDLPWEQQSIIFAVLSVVAVYVGRTWFKRNATPSDHPTLNQRGAQYVGRRFTLNEPIVNGTGKMKVDDTTWKISGPDLKKGVHVVVTGIDGTALEVIKAPQDSGT